MAWKRRGFRKRRGVWLPIIGSTTADDAAVELEGNLVNQRTANLFTSTAAGTAGEIIWDAQGITWDFPLAESAVQTSAFGSGAGYVTLHDMVQGNEYKLLRAVGKNWAWVASAGGTPAGGNRLPAVQAASGLIVCRTDDDGTPTTDFTFVNPLCSNSAEDPWVWRRIWNLGAAPNYAGRVDLVANAWDTGYVDWPTFNWAYGSVLDGPHLDAKTRRRVHRQERLFWVNAIRGISNNMAELTGTFTTVQVAFTLDIRLFGQIIASSAGNRGNASR